MLTSVTEVTRHNLPLCQLLKSSTCRQFEFWNFLSVVSVSVSRNPAHDFDLYFTESNTFSEKLLFRELIM